MSRSKERGMLKVLAGIAAGNGLEPEVFVSCLLRAWKEGEDRCGNLKILRRTKTDTDVVFLFTEDDKVAGQFPIATRYLEREKTLISTIAYYISQKFENE